MPHLRPNVTQYSDLYYTAVQVGEFIQLKQVIIVISTHSSYGIVRWNMHNTFAVYSTVQDVHVVNKAQLNVGLMLHNTRNIGGHICLA